MEDYVSFASQSNNEPSSSLFIEGGKEGVGGHINEQGGRIEGQLGTRLEGPHLLGSPISYAPSHIGYMKLLDYCDSVGCPRYFLDGFLKIIGQEEGFDPLKAPKHESYAFQMKKQFKGTIPAWQCVNIGLIVDHGDPFLVEALTEYYHQLEGLLP